MQQDRIAEVRRAFPSLGEMTYLNVATHGLTPQPVLDRYLEMISLTAHYGHMVLQRRGRAGLRRARVAVAGDPRRAARHGWPSAATPPTESTMCSAA